MTFRPSRRHLLIALPSLPVALLLGGCTTSDLLPGGDTTARDETKSSLPLVNSVRQSKGLSPLSIEPAAQAAALEQARRMARAGEMSHLIGFNDSFLRRMKGKNVPLPAAENIAAGQDQAEEAFEAWRRSERHLRNMLGSFRGLGVAVAQDSASANRPYWAMVLSS